MYAPTEATIRSLPLMALCSALAVGGALAFCGQALGADTRPEYRTLREDLAAQQRNVARLTAQLASTPLPRSVKTAPARLLRAVEREARATRRVWGTVWGRGTRDGDVLRIDLGDPARTVTSYSGFGEPLGAGARRGQQHLWVVSNAQTAQEGSILETRATRSREARIEVDSRPGSCSGELDVVEMSTARRHRDGFRRRVSAMAEQRADGSWLLRRTYQGAQVDVSSGELLATNRRATRHYLVAIDGKRKPISEAEYGRLRSEYLEWVLSR